MPPRSLYEYGAQAALPIWIDFMRHALKTIPYSTMTRPPGLVTVRIDPATGLRSYPGQSNAMFEIFRQEYAPQRAARQPRQKRYQRYQSHSNAYDHPESTVAPGFHYGNESLF